MEKSETTVNRVENITRTKGFRTNADIENFYRFVSEHDLRREAKLVLTEFVGLNSKKKTKSRKKSKKRTTPVQ